MRAILSPAVALLIRLSNEQKLPLISALFVLPLAVLYYETESHVSAALAWSLAGMLLLASYVMAAFYVQADVGWRLLIGAFQRLAEGDLTARVGVPLGGHFAIVMRVLENVNRSLGAIVSQVRASSDAVATAAKGIAQGSADLSRRTEQQAATLEETASSMEQLSATVKQNADSCRLALELAQDTETIARAGAEKVHAVVEGMGRIHQSSQRVADIIATIEGIAFQTNILALNAAVEAARAGEHGQGFGVVASEVRALAERSAGAAKEIRSLIEQSVDENASGSRQAEDAGKGIDEIVASVRRTNELIRRVASASAEQSAGVGEVNRVVLQLESVTQQNAALAERAAASSRAFEDHADRLTQVVARFRTAEDTAPARRDPAAAPLAHQPTRG
jgi:methyl-accepting chemotaxis protein